MSSQVREWAGKFGDEYTKRNRVDWRARLPFWQHVMEILPEVRSVLEVGCNAGWNLTAIKCAAPWVATYGCDVNIAALNAALLAGHKPYYAEAKDVAEKYQNKHDLVFTAGVLIHIPVTEIPKVMQSIAAASARYVLAIEYASDAEAEVLYRGANDMLWKRPFGRLYEEIGMRCFRSGFLGKDQGFDDCTWWLLEKPQ